MANVYLKEKAYYNKVYKVSQMYNKPPEEVFYYPIWLNIVMMTLNSEAIYEVGCGSGQLAKLLLNAGRNYVRGWDYAEQAIKLAHELNPDHKDKFVCRDLYTFKGFIRGITVISTEVLEHLDDDEFVIKLLPKGTRFIFSVPDYKAETHKRVFKTRRAIELRYPTLRVTYCKKFKVSRHGSIFLVDSVKR